MFEIGPFRLDPHAKVLMHGHDPVALGPRAVEVLTVLVERAHQHVAKSHIIEAAWPGRIVEESNLNVQISAIRRALDRAPGGSQWVETLPRRGYRFVGPVTRLASSGSPDAGSAGELPASLTTFIGRKSELDAIGQLLTHARLVTLTGIGGIGKTRLARQVAGTAAARYRDGAWFADFTPLSDPSRVAGTVAAAVSAQVPAGQPVENALCAHLRARELLLVLDNCEHVLDACRPLVRRLLESLPGLTVMVTSREPLGLEGEQCFLVPPLSVPAVDADDEAIGAADAVALFVDRARLSRSDFEWRSHAASVARLCAGLDGIPLALELAAARMLTLSVEQLVGRLQDRFTLLEAGTEGASPRRQAVRAALDWSHDLLPEPVQVLFRRCAVFAGGFSLEAARHMAGNAPVGAEEALAQLIGRSLVSADTSGIAARYRMLETTRAYAVEKLQAAGEIALARRRHVESVATEFKDAIPRWLSDSERAWRARYVADVDNVRAALDHAFDGGPVATGVTLAASSGPLWTHLSLWTEGAERLQRAIDQAPADTPARELGQLRIWHAILRDATPDEALPSLYKAVELYEAIGDEWGLADAHARLSRLLARMGRLEEAAAATDKTAALLNSPLPRSRAFYHVGVAFLASQQGDHRRAQASYELSTRCFQEAGADYAAMATLGAQADTAWAMGEHRRAADLFDQALALLDASPMPRRNSVGYALANRSGVLTELGDLVAARRSAQQAVPILRETGYAWIFMDHFALRLALEGRVREAAYLAGFTDAAYTSHQAVRESNEARARSRLQSLLDNALGEDACRVLAGEGSRLALPDACELALTA